MDKYQLRFVVSTVCIILQSNLIQAATTSDKPTNGGCTVYQFRIPLSSISNNGNNSPQCQGCNSNYPYPYYSQLAQYYSNICSNCQGSLCRSKCNNNQLNLGSSTNSVSISLPTQTPGGRTTITLVPGSGAPVTSTAPATPNQPTPDNNGENNIDVVVKIEPINKNNTNATATTSAKSKAEHSQDGNKIQALTTAQDIDPNSDQDFQVSVYVNDVNTGTLPAKTSLRSKIISQNENGDVLASKTNSVIERNSAILAADGIDSNVTGNTPPTSPPPSSPPATPPVKPAPAVDTPPASSPTPASPPVKPDAPPADPSSPPADSPAPAPATSASAASADDTGASAASAAGSG